MDSEDVQEKYKQLISSGATAISSEMMFGEEQSKQEAGRWSTPSMVSFTEKLQDHLTVARASIGSGSVQDYKAQAK